MLGLGNPQEVLKAISERHKLEPNGEPSLQNAIEMARSSMRYTLQSYSFLLPRSNRANGVPCKPPAYPLI